MTGKEDSAARPRRRSGLGRPAAWVLVWVLWSFAALGVLSAQAGNANVCRSR